MFKNKTRHLKKFLDVVFLGEKKENRQGSDQALRNLRNLTFWFFRLMETLHARFLTQHFVAAACCRNLK